MSELSTWTVLFVAVSNLYLYFKLGRLEARIELLRCVVRKLAVANLDQLTNGGKP